MKIIFYLYLLLTLSIPINTTLIRSDQINTLKQNYNFRKLMILPKLKKNKRKGNQISLKRDKRQLFGLTDLMSLVKNVASGIKKIFGFLFQLKTALILGAILLGILFCIEDSQVFCPFRIIQDMLKSIFGRWLEAKRVPKFIKKNKFIKNFNHKNKKFHMVKIAMVRYLKDNFYDFNRSNINKDVFFDITKGFSEAVYGKQSEKVNGKMKNMLNLLFRNKSYILRKFTSSKNNK